MTISTVAAIGFVGLSTISSGCSGGSYVSNPVAPSPPPIQAAISTTDRNPGIWLGGTYTLTPVSLYGLVYEETAVGRVGIAGAAVYCEVCGAETHTWAKADSNGFYRFSADIATGGGVWLQTGALTVVGVQHESYLDPPGVPLMFNRTGWRQATVSGDTQFDIQLVRR
jgi:hypothetical protein